MTSLRDIAMRNQAARQSSASGVTLFTPPKNHYHHIQPKFKETEIEYANYPIAQIKAPFQMLIMGTTGSGKTNALLDVIERMNCFERVHLYIKNKDEALYADLVDKLKKAEKTLGQEIIQVDNKMDDLPEVDEKHYDKKKHTLVVFDDMMNEKDRMLNRGMNYFSMGRKVGISAVWISQSFYATPARIRQNCSYFVCCKMTLGRNIRMIVNDLQLDQNEDGLMHMYDHVMKLGFPNFLMIDKKHSDRRFQYRLNFAPMDMPTAQPAPPEDEKRDREHDKDGQHATGERLASELALLAAEPPQPKRRRRVRAVRVDKPTTTARGFW